MQPSPDILSELTASLKSAAPALTLLPLYARDLPVALAAFNLSSRKPH